MSATIEFDCPLCNGSGEYLNIGMPGPMCCPACLGYGVVGMDKIDKALKMKLESIRNNSFLLGLFVGFALFCILHRF